MGAGIHLDADPASTRVDIEALHGRGYQEVLHIFGLVPASYGGDMLAEGTDHFGGRRPAVVEGQTTGALQAHP